MKFQLSSIQSQIGILLLLSLIAYSLMSCDAKAKGKKYLINIDENGILMEGYDPVAYFTAKKPVKGDPSFSYTWHEATYHFVSEEHKEMFSAHPEKYMPQYGSYCAYAVSRNKLRPINPIYFQIVDGRLMLQHSQHALDLFSKDIPSNTKMADKNWPDIVAQKKGKLAVGQYDTAVKK